MGRRAGASISKDDVVRAGVAVVQRDGADALGTAAVARELGIRAPSVYHHFDGNGPLRLAVATEGWRRLVASLPPPDDDIAATLRGFAHAYRRFALGHGALYHVMTNTPFDPTDPALLAVTARAALALAPLGLSGDDTIHAVRGLRAVVHGFVAQELAGQLRLAVSPDASFAWLVDRVVPAFAGRAHPRGPRR